MKIKNLLILAITPLLMATQCGDDVPFDGYNYNETKVSITEESNLLINDTLWITGKVSLMIADKITGDSIMNSNEYIRDIISVMRLKSADNKSNTIEAIDEFVFVARAGNIDFLGACPNSELIAQAPFSDNGQEYEYQIGLVPTNPGDFVLSWLEPVNIINSDLNIEILEEYPFNDSGKHLELIKCGITSSILDVEESRDEFFFSVK